MPTLDRHSILIFDELIIENWELDEYKVIEEFCGANYFANEVLAISFPLSVTQDHWYMNTLKGITDYALVN